MKAHLTRARALAGLCGLAAAAALARRPGRAAQAEKFEVSYGDAQWRRRLGDARYQILREAGTEPPFSSPLDAEKRPGRYLCAGCELALFDAKTKFDSGTGWPSFYQPLPHAVATTTDTSLMMTRTEVHCRRCGGHLGHVFDDGPPPTGLRYCMNGLALLFHPA
jgi:peptide-methionine (R)-S-oxide reductase